MFKIGSKKVLKLFLIILEWSIFGGLMIGVGFFVQEVWNDYKSQVTTVKQYSEKWEKIIPPTMTFCFNPPVKPSVLEKYNISLPEFLGYRSFESNISLLEEGFYQIGRDFNVKRLEKTLNVEDNDEKESIKQIYTFWNGFCYQFTSKVKVEKLEYFSIDVIMNNVSRIGQLPKVDFYLTSEENSHGIIIDQWNDGGQPLHQETNFNGEIDYCPYLHLLVHKRLPKVSNCSEIAHPLVCGTKKYFSLQKLFQKLNNYIYFLAF